MNRTVELIRSLITEDLERNKILSIVENHIATMIDFMLEKIEEDGHIVLYDYYSRTPGSESYNRIFDSVISSFNDMHEIQRFMRVSRFRSFPIPTEIEWYVYYLKMMPSYLLDLQRSDKIEIILVDNPFQRTVKDASYDDAILRAGSDIGNLSKLRQYVPELAIEIWPELEEKLP